MKRARLHTWEACRDGWRSLAQQPRLLLGFSLACLSGHLLGWGLFAAADAVDSGVLAALLHLVGLTLYSGSLLWLVEGLSRAGLAQVQGHPLSWDELMHWRSRSIRRLLLCLINLAAALAATATISFVLWSLLVLVLPAMSVVPALLGLITAAGLGLSQLFAPCLLLDTRLSPAAIFRQGALLLEHHWAGLLLLSGALAGLLLCPLLVGLLAEAMVAGVGVAATALALVVVLPLSATTVTAAYQQLSPEVQARVGVSRAVR